MFLVSKDQIGHLRRSKNVLNLEILCITKLKALYSKYLSNPSVSSRVPTIWTYNCSLTQLFLKFSENLKKNISGGAHTVLPLISTPSPTPPPPPAPLLRRLLNFETGRFLLEGGVYFKVREIDRIIIIKTLSFLFQNEN